MQRGRPSRLAFDPDLQQANLRLRFRHAVDQPHVGRGPGPGCPSCVLLLSAPRQSCPSGTMPSEH
eukprot:8464890-Lingulodinium_polyedra.AAC.1